jgi:hypothetical protein
VFTHTHTERERQTDREREREREREKEREGRREVGREGGREREREGERERRETLQPDGRLLLTNSLTNSPPHELSTDSKRNTTARRTDRHMCTGLEGERTMSTTHELSH